MRTRESASRKSISRRFDQVLKGTGIAPSAAAPRQMSIHSIRLLTSIPMRSPRPIPAERNAEATRRARCGSSGYVARTSPAMTATRSG